MPQINLRINVNVARATLPPPPPDDLGFYRILIDRETAFYNYASRTSTDEWKAKWPPDDPHPITPMTIKFSGGRTPLTISDRAAKLVETLDAPHGTYGYVIRTSAGWSNRGEIFPKVEQLTFCNNVVKVIGIEGRRAYIQPWRGETDPIEAAHVIHRWYNVNERGDVLDCQNPGGDGIGYIVLDYPDGIWLDIARLVKL